MQTPSRGGTLTVSELNRQVRHLLEVSFMQVLVEGEISGFSRPSSGHWYFTLKDANAQVSCAMFRNRNQSVKTLPRDGDHVLVRAKVSLFEGRGNFQLLVEGLEPAGLGALQQAFEALKTRLADEGLFDPARKRAIPALPHHVGIVTSPTGAAIHDILTVMRRRFPAIPVTLFPTAVQGQAAADEIVRAIETANLHSDCDVLIVGRGGGSLEDLWPFNEERVARAIFQSRIPVISAVGHEVDVTIADFVADLRAPTPSAAAERVAPDQKAWRDQLAQYDERLLLGWRRQTRHHTLHLTQLAQRLRDPAHQLQELGQRLDGLEIRLGQAVRRALLLRQQQAQHQQARL
ncbi:MAG: exodeoxyribonuclease VII large subunit, partial [Gammaproteobacteria bacterium]|nr:exodeoxyribonuclease VII large subunit [Gammaproteobacteria bacterium]